jgi:flagellar biosynthesis protein FlhA
MGNAFFGQIFARSTPMVLAGGLMLALFLIPGFPKLPLLAVGGGIGFLAFKMRQSEKETAASGERQAAADAKAAQKQPEDPMKLLNVDTLLLELGSSLVPLALPDEGGDLANRVGGARKQIATELGIILPMVRIRDNLQLRSHQYVIKIRDQVVAQHEIYPDQILAIDTGTVLTPVEGAKTTEPAFGLPAVWIPRSMRERADLSGYHLALPAEVIITHLTETIKQHAFELISRQDVQALVEHAKLADKVVVEELIPGLMSLGEVQKVLQNLLRERVCVRDLTSILETLADWSPRTKDLDQLTEYVRAALARQVCKQNADDAGALNVMTIDPLLEQQLREAVQMTQSGVTLAIDHTRASALIAALRSEAERISQEGYSPILLCSSQIRLAVKRLTERSLPALTVLAYNEVVPQIEVNAVGNVSLDGGQLTIDDGSHMAVVKASSNGSNGGVRTVGAAEAAA